MKPLRGAVLSMAVGLATACGPKAFAEVRAPTVHQLTEHGRQFLNRAAQDNQAALTLCLLAEQKAAAPAVQALARFLVDDRTEIEGRLATLTKRDRVMVSNGTGKQGDAAEIRLMPLKGAAFDEAFLNEQISDQTRDIVRYSHEQARTEDRGIRRYADAAIPMLQQQLALTQSVRSALSESRAKAKTMVGQ